MRMAQAFCSRLHEHAGVRSATLHLRTLDWLAHARARHITMN
jgi:hypothetical protein